MAATNSDKFWTGNKEMAKLYEENLKAGPAAQLPLLPAIELVNRSNILQARAPIKLLDNASGPATLVDIIYPQLSDDQKDGLEILCTDIGAPMIEMAQQKAEKNGWQGVTARVLDSNDLSSLPDAHFTHILTGLGINFVKDADATLKDMHRILAPGGINAFSTWETVGWIEHVKEAFKLVPGAPDFPAAKEGFAKLQHGNKWHEKDWIQEKVSKYYDDVQQYHQAKVYKWPVDDFVRVFGGPMTKGMLAIFWGEESQVKYKDELEPALRKYFNQKGAKEVELVMDAIITVAKKG